MVKRRTGKKALNPALREWIDRVKRYQNEHGVSYKEAMIALKGKKGGGIRRKASKRKVSQHVKFAGSKSRKPTKKASRKGTRKQRGGDLNSIMNTIGSIANVATKILPLFI